MDRAIVTSLICSQSTFIKSQEALWPLTPWFFGTRCDNRWMRGEARENMHFYKNLADIYRLLSRAVLGCSKLISVVELAILMLGCIEYWLTYTLSCMWSLNIVHTHTCINEWQGIWFKVPNCSSEIDPHTHTPMEDPMETVHSSVSSPRFNMQKSQGLHDQSS